MLGRCILWQVPGLAPGTANSATFLPLKMSSVVLACGPSAVITRNLASGSLSPTLMVMVNSPCKVWGCLNSFCGEEETASPSFDGRECRNYLHAVARRRAGGSA